MGVISAWAWERWPRRSHRLGGEPRLDPWQNNQEDVAREIGGKAEGRGSRQSRLNGESHKGCRKIKKKRTIKSLGLATRISLMTLMQLVSVALRRGSQTAGGGEGSGKLA